MLSPSKYVYASLRSSPLTVTDFSIGAKTRLYARNVKWTGFSSKEYLYTKNYTKLFYVNIVIFSVVFVILYVYIIRFSS